MEKQMVYASTTTQGGLIRSVEHPTSASEVRATTKRNPPRIVGAIIRSVGDAAEVGSSRPVMLSRDPMLAMALMLRQGRRRRRPQRRELTLPPGCVLAVRYSSR